MMNAQQRELLVGAEVDKLFRWPRGRAVRMARQGKLPGLVLPDGEWRFKREAVQRIIDSGADQADANLAGDQRQLVVRNGRAVETAARGVVGRESR